MTATGRHVGHREPPSSGPEGSEPVPPPAQGRPEAGASAKEARSEAIIRSALDCVVIMDHHGLIREFNPAAEAVFGYSRDEAVGRPLVETIVPPSLRERHRMGLAHHLATGEKRVIGRRVEMTAMRKDGVPVNVTPLGALVTHAPTLMPEVNEAESGPLTKSMVALVSPGTFASAMAP